jgi:hypothetical protein
LQIGTANIIKQISGGFAVRNVADNADGKVQASQFEASGNTGLIINSDAAGTGADWTITINRAASGMTASYTLTLPIDDGSPSQVLGTDGSGNLSWISAGSVADKITVDTTSLAFGTASPLTLFSTPSGAIIHKVEVVIDTQFNGSPTLTIGIAGTTSKYMSSGQNLLTSVATTGYEANPKLPGTAGEALIATYSAGGASTGAARILVYYSIPS